jgi:hypothetical protein
VRAVATTSTASYFGKRIQTLLRSGPDRYFQIARPDSNAADISLRGRGRAFMAGRGAEIGERRGGKIERARSVDTSPCGRLRWIGESSWVLALLRGTSGRGLHGGGDSGGIVQGSGCGNDMGTCSLAKLRLA